MPSMQDLKNFIILLAFVFVWVIALALSGCAATIHTPKEVLVPTKCDVPLREKPQKNASLTLYLKDILIYTEGLERDLNYCRGEK